MHTHTHTHVTQRLIKKRFERMIIEEHDDIEDSNNSLGRGVIDEYIILNTVTTDLTTITTLTVTRTNTTT